jgi:hypothetical protein
MRARRMRSLGDGWDSAAVAAVLIRKVRRVVFMVGDPLLRKHHIPGEEEYGCAQGPDG